MAAVSTVFIPGLLSDARVWRPVAETLTASRGIHHADVRHDNSIEGMAARTLSAVPGPIVVIGHSMGGRVAMEVARQAPDRVRALVLADTGHNGPQPGEEATRLARVALGFEDMARLAGDWLPPMLAPESLGDTGLVADLTQMVLSIGPEVHERQITALLSRPDAGAYLPEITCPTLLMTGALDSWSPVAQHREIAEMMPDAELHVIEDAGHFMPIEKPGEATHVIVEWLQRRAASIGQ